MTELKLRAIKTLDYERPAVRRGYADHTLSVDLSDSTISVDVVSDRMKETFVGGKGFDLWLLWNAVKGTTRWNDPENAICIACGPLGGTPIYPGSGKSIVTSISPTTGSRDRFQRGRLLRPLPQVLRFRCPRDPGQDRICLRSSSSTASSSRCRSLEVAGLPEEAYEISEILTDHFGQGKPRNISVVSTGPGAEAYPHRLPQLLLVRPEEIEEPAEAGRPRRHRNRIRRQGPARPSWPAGIR